MTAEPEAVIFDPVTNETMVVTLCAQHVEAASAALSALGLPGHADAQSDLSRLMMLFALSVFGPDRLSEKKGCAGCVFDSVLTMFADDCAAKHTRTN
jgi:hypothetical protein